MAELTIRTLPASAGLTWLRSGLQLLGRSPLRMVLMVALGPLISFTIILVPVAGTALALILVPLMSVGMLSVCRSVDQGLPPGPQDYAAALRDPFARWQLLRIGVAYALAIGLLTTIWYWLPSDPTSVAAVSPATVAAAPTPAGEAPVAPAVAQMGEMAFTPARVAIALAFILAAIPVEMCVWFAPALIAWHGMRGGKALFFSFFACWRNRAPMLVYLLAFFGLVLLAVLAFGAFLGAINAREGVARILLAPLPLSLLAISKACAYRIYRDLVFEQPPAAAEPADADPA